MAVILNVQQGTALFATGILRVDVPITSVDTSKTFMLTSFVGGGNGEGSRTYTRSDLYATDSFALIRQETGDALTVQWYVAQFSDGAVVRHGTAPLATSTGTTLLPATVDTANAFLLMSYETGVSDYAASSLIRGEFVSPDSARFVANAGAASIVIGYQTVELTGARTQAGTTSLSAATTTTNVAITAVDLTKAAILSNQRGDDNDGSELGLRLFFTNETTLTIDRFDVGPAVQTSWFIVEMTDGTVVQSGTSPVPTTAGTDVTISSVDTSRSVGWLSGHLCGGGQYQVGNVGDDFRQFHGLARLTSPTNLFLDCVSGDYNGGWFVLQFNTAGQAAPVVAAADAGSYIFMWG